MNRLFFRLVCLTIPLLFNSAKSQPDHFAYAISAVNKGGSDWIALRKLDIRTGAFSSILLNVQDANPVILNPVHNISLIGQPSTVNGQPSNVNGVAAIAYDRKANRLYYTTMNIDQLRYIDLNTMESFSVADQYFSKAGNYDSRNAGPINRLVIGPDDFGYTITNDGTHLIRFTTHGSPVLTDLGDLVDDPLNKEMTIHSPCSNSGGDLVADDAGHLYLITGSNKVYKVDIATRVTTYQATITGLPQKFTTSGVAVSEDGRQILAVSSTYSDAYFIIDPETWHASPAMAKNDLYESADLANSNILFTKSIANDGLFIIKNPENWNRIRIFPNPAMDDEVNIQFNQLTPGNYTIQLANSLGKTVIQQKVIITSSAQTESMHLPHYTSQGFYYVRILDDKNNVVSTQKLVVERW